MLEHLTRQGCSWWTVASPRPAHASSADARASRCGGSGGDDKQPVLQPIRHAWCVEVAHGRLGRARRLAKSFENTTTSATGWLQVACIATTLRHLSAVRGRRRRVPPAA